jgi:ABC-type glutathione transport system ATPase component
LQVFFINTMSELTNLRKRKKRDDSEDSSICADDDKYDYGYQDHNQGTDCQAVALFDSSSLADISDDDVSHHMRFAVDTDESESDEEDIEDSDEEETDEGEIDEGGYDDGTEDRPCHPVYDKAFAQVETDLAKMAMNVIKIIEQSGCRNDRAKGCLEKARWLLNLPDTKKEMIALIGESGVGKSSLINSLLSIPKLARAVSTHS